MMRDDAVSSAVAIARSSAPGSSGFGKGSVGNEPSGANCSRDRRHTRVNPASSKSRVITAPPTPCSGV